MRDGLSTQCCCLIEPPHLILYRRWFGISFRLALLASHVWLYIMCSHQSFVLRLLWSHSVIAVTPESSSTSSRWAFGQEQCNSCSSSATASTGTDSLTWTDAAWRTSLSWQCRTFVRGAATNSTCCVACRCGVAEKPRRWRERRRGTRPGSLPLC